MKPEVLEFLCLNESLVVWADRHPELIAQAQAYARRNDSKRGTHTGVAELDGLDVSDEYDDDE